MKKTLVMAFICCVSAAWAQNTKTDIQDQPKTNNMKKADGTLDGRSYRITLKSTVASEETGRSGNVQQKDNMADRKKPAEMKDNPSSYENKNPSVIEQKTQTDNTAPVPENKSIMGNEDMQAAQTPSSPMYTENQVMVISFEDGMLMTDVNQKLDKSHQTGQNKSEQSSSKYGDASTSKNYNQNVQSQSATGVNSENNSGLNNQNNTGNQAGRTDMGNQSGVTNQTDQMGQPMPGSSGQNQGTNGQNSQINQTGQPDRTGAATQDYRTFEANTDCPYTVTSGSGTLSTFSASCPSEGRGRTTWTGFINEGSISGSMIYYDSNGMSTRYSFTGKLTKSTTGRKATSAR